MKEKEAKKRGKEREGEREKGGERGDREREERKRERVNHYTSSFTAFRITASHKWTKKTTGRSHHCSGEYNLHAMSCLTT